jgi:DNA-binding transcriptional regulator YiaG
MKVNNRRDGRSDQTATPSVTVTLDCQVTVRDDRVMQMSEIMLLVEAHKKARSGDAKKIRQKAGLTMAQVAAVIGVGESTVSRWEGGSRKPRGEHALKWAALLNELEQSAVDAVAA